MADKDVKAAAQEAIQKEREQRAKNIAEAEKRYGTPTPTQEENDLAALGVAVTEHQDDGSGPEPKVNLTRQVEAEKPAGGQYTTRHATSRSATAASSSS
jgi:hypothetical protein